MHCDFDVLGYFFEDFKTGEFYFGQKVLTKANIKNAM